MLARVKILLLAAISLIALPMNVGNGQDYFPDTIAPGLRVGVRDFANIPNDSGAASRMAVMSKDPLGRMFVNDQQGRIHQVSSNGQTVTPYIDIRNFSGVSLINSGERGFQSFAFHPDFASTGTGGFGKFYTVHSSSNQSPPADFAIGSGNAFHTVVLEWSTSNPNASSYSAGGNNAPREILRFGQPFSNHNAGQLAFNTSVGAGSTDRNNLYLALGDGGSGGDPLGAGQNTSNPFGSILRINPLGNNSANGKYGIVAENVLASDGSSSTLGEIYSFGLRNPQRFSWDSLTGNMFIADIGQNAVEEIDLGVNGGNFGWSPREGSFQFSGPKTAGMIDPVFEYDHTNPVAIMPTSIGSRAVTVGDVARGTGIPGLDGNLILGDFPTGLIFYGNVDTDPLNGGQDGLRELVLVDASDRDVRLLQLINETRTGRGLSTVSRADLRFSYGINGQIFVLNKQDGVIRQLVVLNVPEPSTIGLLALAGIGFVGIRRRKRRRI